MSIHVTPAATTRTTPHRRSTSALQVMLLGGLQVRMGETVLGPRQLGGVKPRHLLIALALAHGAPVSKDQLISILWDDVRPVAATATLESYVSVLRHHLKVPGAGRQGPIVTLAGSYCLDLDRVELDVAVLANDIGRALHPGVSAAAALPLLRQALADAGTPLLPDEARAPWLDAIRAEHERATIEWLVAASMKVVDIAPGDAARWARRAVDLDPLDEEAWHAYLRSKEVAGHHAEGLRAYARCRQVFADELGCEPGTRLQELHGRLLGGSAPAGSELEDLIEAVVRLHRVARGGHLDGDVLPQPLVGRGPGAPEARQMLSDLLRCASSAPPRPMRSASA